VNTNGYPLQAIRTLVNDIINIDPKIHCQEDYFDYIDISSIDRELKQVSGLNRILREEAPSRARQLVEAGDVLVSTVRPNLNAVAVVPEELNYAIASTGFCVLRANPKLLSNRYLYHWVRTSKFVSEMERLATGASYPAVSDRVILESKIPTPEITEQLKIAAILDKTDAIRRKRQQASVLMKELPLAFFREVFGNSRYDQGGEEPLAQVAEVVSGVAKGRKLNGQSVLEVPYLRVANVQAGFLDLTEVKTISATQSEIADLTLQYGDIVMTEGGDHDKLGRGALWDQNMPNCIHQNHVFRVRTKQDQLLPSYFVHFLQTEPARAYFLKCAKKTSNLASINMRQLRALPVPVPPLKLQEQFDQEIQTVYRLIENQRAMEQESVTLFNALVQRAFCGEL
jgi:type I restriction enzyme, S subunit